MGNKAHRAYCHQCRNPTSSGYCIGTPEKLHQPEPCPPCGDCRSKCDWRDGHGCRRFTINPKVMYIKAQQVAAWNTKGNAV